MNRDAFIGDGGSQQEGQQQHHYGFIPDGFSSLFVDIEGDESVTPSHRFLQGRYIKAIFSKWMLIIEKNKWFLMNYPNLHLSISNPCKFLTIYNIEVNWIRPWKCFNLLLQQKSVIDVNFESNGPQKSSSSCNTPEEKFDKKCRRRQLSNLGNSCSKFLV